MSDKRERERKKRGKNEVFARKKVIRQSDMVSVGWMWERKENLLRKSKRK